MNGGGRHAAHPQDAGGLVGGCEDRQRAPVAPPSPLPIAGHDIDPRLFEGAKQRRQKQGLARAGLADHRHHAGTAFARRRELTAVEIDARGTQHLGDAVMGFGLIVGECECAAGHGATLSKPRDQHQRQRQGQADGDQTRLPSPWESAPVPMRALCSPPSAS